MKASHNQGVTNPVAHESCLDDPRGREETLTMGSAGGLMSVLVFYAFEAEFAFSSYDVNDNHFSTLNPVVN